MTITLTNLKETRKTTYAWQCLTPKDLVKTTMTICSKHGIQIYFKDGNIIKNLLMAPNDKETIIQKSGMIYRYKCDRLDRDEEYIWESARNFGETLKEHFKANSQF